MKLTNKSYIFLLLFFFTSCISKKLVTDIQERVKVDTVYKTKTIKEIQRFTDTLTIENPCDTITGNLKPFKQLISTKQGKVSIQGKNNVITAEIDLNGYKDVLEETYKTKYDSFIKNYNKEVVKYKTPFTHWLIHIICVLVIFLLLKIR